MNYSDWKAEVTACKNVAKAVDLPMMYRPETLTLIRQTAINRLKELVKTESFVLNVLLDLPENEPWEV